jgi:hypothetical protein
VSGFQELSMMAVSRRLPKRQTGFLPRQGQLGFVVNKVAGFLKVIKLAVPVPNPLTVHTHHLSSGTGVRG